jgi:bifunctional non-homologous end joining protein LigD
MARGATKRVGGVDVELTRLDKPFFPGDGITKGDLIEYYERVAPAMIAYLGDRPLVMGRYPDGIDGQRIVQKNVPGHFPGWISRAEVSKRDGMVCHVVGDKPATLVYLANQGCVELHAFLSALGTLDRPDQLVFDLDPPDAEHFGQACHHVRGLRALLGDLGLPACVKTTGGKGLHVHVPLRPEEDFDSVRDFARGVASVLVSRAPEQLTIERRKEDRGQRLYLDIMRNAYAQTAVAPYSVRARPGATVATPLDWDEIDGDLSPRQFTIRTIGDRTDRSSGPWQGMARHRRGLDGPRRKLAAIKREEGSSRTPA